MAAPADELWRRVYFGLGGVWARLVEDDVLGPSLFVGLQYKGSHEELIVGLNNLEEGNRDTIDNWLSRYNDRKDGVIVSPLSLETAVAVGMYSLKDVPFFAREVDAYRNSFRAAVEGVWPVYGKLTYGPGARASFVELGLDGVRLRRDVDVPVLPGNYSVLAPEQEEDAQEQSVISPAVERCLELLAGEKNPGRVFQYWASRNDGRKRETGLWAPDGNWRRQSPERALVLGRGDGRFVVVCGVDVGGRPARGCRRAKNFQCI